MNSAVKLLEQAAEKFRENSAFEDNSKTISFSELRERGRGVGTALINLAHISKNKPVIVYLEKSVNSVVCFMGALYSACPYVPTDYNIPLTQLEKTIEILQPGAIITDEAGRNKISSIQCNAPVLIIDEIIKTKADNALIDKTISGVIDLDPAYIMYTSGSTGTPKGVTITHRGVIDYAVWIENTFPIDSKSIIGMQSAFHFDMSTFNIYAALCTGAKTVLIPEVLFMYSDKLLDYMAQAKISVIFWVPTALITTANSGALEKIPLPDLKLVIFGGEIMPNAQLNIWRKYLPDCMYVNLYGPTEVTVNATIYIVDREFENHESLPIGTACKNKKIIILNDDNKLCEIGETGEICVGGSGVSSGYWNEPELTEKVFVQNPLNSKYDEIIYRTGDLAYENEEGNIIFLGRRDSQIKLNGIRIELGEIESAAAAVDGVSNACVLFDEERKETLLLVEMDKEISERKFRNELRNYIPHYMIPKKVMALKIFPHTSSGKIDRVGLREKYIKNRKEEK